MSLELFGHPFSSYTWKALIPLFANGAESKVPDGAGDERRERWAREEV